MTTKPNIQIEETFVLPDPPERDADDMTSVLYLHSNGNIHHLKQHLGNLETTIVGGELYVTLAPGERRRVPDLLVAFNADIASYIGRSGYIIAEQGKPPDFVLEVASKRTGRRDVTSKRRDYATMGIPEYWRFDHTGDFHEEKIAGDRLSDGTYVPIDIKTLEQDILQGYSPVLKVMIRWDHGELVFVDPGTEAPITTFTDERNRRIRAEERIRQLEEENRRLRGE